MFEPKRVIMIGTIILLGIFIGWFILKCKNKNSFDINVDPLRATNYDRMVSGCSPTSPPVGYGINKEHYKDIGVCDFIKKFEGDTEFAENINQDPCDVISRQICEVLYQNQQQYFENMWSGIGECEVFQKEKCKKCPKGLIKTSS